MFMFMMSVTFIEIILDWAEQQRDEGGFFKERTTVA